MTKLVVVFVCLSVLLLALQYYFIILRSDQPPYRYRVQQSFTSSPTHSGSSFSEGNTPNKSPLHALGPILICSPQEPYDLSLCLPTTEATTAGIVEKRCRPEYEIFGAHGNKCISYDMLQRMPDEVLAMARGPAMFSIYPQDVPLSNIMQAVKQRSPIPVPPINNPKFVLKRTSQSVCPMNGTARRKLYELIIIVKSAPINAARRVRLRRLISNQTAKINSSVGLLFSLGVPADLGNRSRLLNAVSEEAARFDDIILTDFMDTYYNLSLKTLLNLRFAHVACEGASPLFAFMDDDRGLNLAALLDYFHTFDRKVKHRGRLRHTIFGHIQQRSVVHRNKQIKWAVTRSDMPFDIYPAFASGPCYFIGAEAVAALSIAAAFTKTFPLEDVYVGLTAVKAGIKMHDLPAVYRHGPPLNTKLQWTPLIASLEYFEMYIP